MASRKFEKQPSKTWSLVGLTKLRGPRRKLTELMRGPLVVRLAITTLSAVVTARAQQVTIVSSEVTGLELIGLQSPDFQSSLEGVVGPQAQLGPYLPFAVVLKNNSSQALVGYEVEWTINGSEEGCGIGMFATKGPDSYLKPGRSIVLVPQFEMRRTPSAELQASMQRKQGSVLYPFQVARTVSISLDSAIFGSGQFVGPDTRKNFARDAAYFTAWRAVDSEVQSRLATNESFGSIAAALSQVADQTIEGSMESRDWNAQVRRKEARELLKLYQRGGVQAVRDRLQQQLQQPEIIVHQ